MSCGERSCAEFGKCTHPHKSPYDCSVNCKKYVWDGKTKPDTCKTVDFKEILKDVLAIHDQEEER
jgi:hypothetical protein